MHTLPLQSCTRRSDTAQLRFSCRSRQPLTDAGLQRADRTFAMSKCLQAATTHVGRLLGFYGILTSLQMNIKPSQISSGAKNLKKKKKSHTKLISHFRIPCSFVVNLESVDPGANK